MINETTRRSQKWTIVFKRLYNESMVEESHSSTGQFPEEFYHDPLGVDRYVVQEKILYSWQAPSKVKKHWTRSQITTVLLIASLVSMILLLSGEFALTLLLIVVVGVSALLASTPPIQLKCVVTTIGVKVEEKYYYWQQMSQFWFEQKDGTHFLYVRNVWPQIHLLKLIIQAEDEEKIKVTIGTYLLFKKPQQTQWQKIQKRLLAQIPFELDPL